MTKWKCKWEREKRERFERKKAKAIQDKVAAIKMQNRGQIRESEQKEGVKREIKCLYPINKSDRERWTRHQQDQGRVWKDRSKQIWRMRSQTIEKNGTALIEFGLFGQLERLQIDRTSRDGHEERMWYTQDTIKLKESRLKVAQTMAVVVKINQTNSLKSDSTVNQQKKQVQMIEKWKNLLK